MKKKLREKGFTSIEVIIVAVVVIALALGGWWVWQKNKDKDAKPPSTEQTSHQAQQTELPPEDVTSDWISVTTQGGKLTMKVPDGWTVTKYPGDYLGSLSVDYTPNTLASIETANIEYSGHSLKFRTIISDLDDAGLGPQWASPQPNLQESVEDFSIGSLQGKRYKGEFMGDINQTLYEYVFNIGAGKKLDILYTVDRNEGQKDDVLIVEKAIKTIKLQ